MMSAPLGDLPPGFDTEQSDEIVGTGGPNIGQVARQIKRPNRNIFVNTGYTLGIESVQVLPSNQNRTYLLIQNKSGGSIFFSFGNKANTYDGVEIVAGGNYEPYIYPSSSLHVIASLAASDIIVIEGYGGESVFFKMPISQPGKFRTSTVDNSFGGDGAGTGNLGDNNTFVGAGAGLDNVGDNNTYIGSNIAAQNSEGSRNTVVGSESFTNFQLGGAVSPDDMTIVGAFNMAGIGSPTPSSDVVSIGSNIGQPITSSQVINRCLFIGETMAANNIAYTDSVFMGIEADGGDEDVVIGNFSGAFMAPGDISTQNVIVGHQAGQFSDVRSGNVFVGYRAGWQGFGNANTDNTCVGWQAGQNLFGAANNVYVGRNAGMGNGDDNVMIGVNLGGNGSRNIFLGHDFNLSQSDLFVVGDGVGDPLMFGSFATRNFGVNVPVNPSSFGNGSGVIGLRNASVIPTTNSGVGGVLYVTGGALTYRGSSGTITTLGAA